MYMSATTTARPHARNGPFSVDMTPVVVGFRQNLVEFIRSEVL
jgi:hypothetical protein